MPFVIKSARYGVGEQTGEFVDVTSAVQKLATKKGLRLARVTNEALGVAVFPGQRKRLWVKYKRDGVVAQASALERKSLTIGV